MYTRSNPHPEVSDLGGQYGYFAGSKYDPKLDIAEIAKRVRAEIKDACKAGTLPQGAYRVTISRFSGGRSLTVRVAPHAAFPLLNPERARLEATQPGAFFPDCHYPRYTPEARAMLDQLRAIVGAYQYDRSDAQSDYFDVNFYEHVNVDGDAEAASRAAILAGAS
jgi:hypothetical protein